MKSKATGCGSISTVFVSIVLIVLLCVSSIIILIIIITIIIIIIIMIIYTVSATHTQKKYFLSPTLTEVTLYATILYATLQAIYTN